MEKRYGSISELLEKELITKEYKDTQLVIDKLTEVESRGFFTKDEFIIMGMWKSPRPKNLYLENTEEEIVETSKEVFSTKYEKRRIELLARLRGVRIPTASAILMLTNPRDYGVIDIRVWEVLYRYGEVNVNPTGTNFSFENWYNYLMKLRYFVKKHLVNARDIERTIFEHDLIHHEGNLY